MAGSRTSAVLVVMTGLVLCASAQAARQGANAKPEQAPAAGGAPATAIKLPAAIDAAAPGSGGRLLILHFRKLRQLAVFDVAEGKVRKYLPLPSDDIIFAAGATKLYVGLKDLKHIQRWNLATLELETTVPAPEGGIVSIAVGPNAVSPVVLAGNKRLWTIDPESLEARRYPSNHWGTENSAWGPTQVRISFDGTTAVACGGGWAGIEVATLAGANVGHIDDGSYVHGYTLVSGDGQLVFPERGGILRSDLSSAGGSIEGTPLPAVHPAYSLSHSGANLTLFANSDTRPLVTLRGFAELAKASKLPSWQRIFLIPQHKALVTVGEGDNQLLVRRFDLAEALAAAPDYLFVESSPLRSADAGSQYSYDLRICSKQGKVTSELQAAPKGMTLNAEGKLRWKVPGDFPDPSATVIIHLADASGRSAFHTFTITVNKPAAVAVAPPASPSPPAQPPRTPQTLPRTPDKPQPPSNPPVPPKPADDAVIVQLDEPFREFHAAAGGRILVFYQPKARQLAAYDTATGKPLGSIRLGVDAIRFACGRDRIVVALPDQGILQAYSLPTLARVKTAPLPDKRPLKDLRMGVDSTGPLFLYFGGEVVAVDPATLAPLRLRGSLPSGEPRWWFQMRVSADGSTLVTWDTYASPSGFTITRIRDGAVDNVASADGFSMATRKFTPTADGSVILYELNFYNAAGRGIPSTLKGYRNTVPTSDPRFFLAVKDGENRNAEVAICATNDRRVIATISRAGDTGIGGHDSSRCGVVADLPGACEPRFVFLPEARLLATVPVSNDRFELRKINLDAAVAGTGTEVKPAPAGATNVRPGEAARLAVVSLPPAEVAVKSTYTYQIQVLPEKARVKYKVESGPDGLTVSPKGVVTWKPANRPLGGSVKVILSISDASGNEVPHAFDIAVTRPPTPPGATASPAGTIVKCDDRRLELPSGEYRFVPGMGGRMLLVCGNQLAVLAPDGFTIQETRTLPKSYLAIGERKEYYVALCQEPRSIDILDRKTLAVRRSRPVAFEGLADLALHPTKPVSYVAYRQPTDKPDRHFLIYDETTGEARIDDNWVGQSLAVAPDGRFLMAGLHEVYQEGHDIIDNPDRIWITPRYGSIDTLARYDLDEYGIPRRVAWKQGVGGNGGQIRLSADGRRVTYLSHVGYPQMSGNLGGWDPLDLGKMPISYRTNGVGSTQDLAFHPLLPLVASPGKGAVAFFERETGEPQADRVDGNQIAGQGISRIYFSPDGKSLILATTIGPVHYLQRVPLKLSPQEIKAVGALPRPDKPVEALPSKPAPPPARQLPQA